MPTSRQRQPSAVEPCWPIASRQWQGARPYQDDKFDTIACSLGEDGAPPGVLMVLADGMGGEAGGAVASRTVIDAFMRGFPRLDGNPGDRFQMCLEAATNSLREQVLADPELEGMGTTVVAVYYDGWELSWLSVGDSPMWLFTAGRLLRLNADHSMAPVLDRLAEDGELSPDEALSDTRRNLLRSAVTSGETELVDSARRSCRLRPDECLLIASDGIQTLAEIDIERRIAASNGDAETAADSLFSAVRAAASPHQDNMTFLILSGAGGGGERAGGWSRDVNWRPAQVPLVGDRWPVAPIWRGLALGLALGLPAGAFTWWLLAEPSRKGEVVPAVAVPGEDEPDSSRTEPALQHTPVPREPSARAVGDPAAKPLKPRVPGSPKPETPGEQAADKVNGEPAGGRERPDGPQVPPGRARENHR